MRGSASLVSGPLLVYTGLFVHTKRPFLGIRKSQRIQVEKGHFSGSRFADIGLFLHIKRPVGLCIYKKRPFFRIKKDSEKTRTVHYVRDRRLFSGSLFTNECLFIFLRTSNTCARERERACTCIVYVHMHTHTYTHTHTFSHTGMCV